MAYSSRFDKEKKALVPDRDYSIGHPLEEKIRKAAFEKHLKVGANYDQMLAFSEQIRTPMRTVVSKTYTDMYQAFRRSNAVSTLTPEEQEQHLDWLFRELAKYQEAAKALILKHHREMQAEVANQKK